MSMICWVMGITPVQSGALRAMPSLAGKLAMSAQDDQRKARFDEAIQRMSPEQRKQFEATRAIKEAQERIAEARERVAELGPFEHALSLEKSWHILHYLFTGHLGPSSAPGDLLLTGEDLGEDVGYGPARLHGQTETRDFSHFLDMQDLARLQARVDFRQMSRIGVYSMPRGPGSDAQYESELRNEVGLIFRFLEITCAICPTRVTAY